MIFDHIFECLIQTDEIRQEIEDHSNKAKNLLKEKRALEANISKYYFIIILLLFYYYFIIILLLLFYIIS